MASKGLRAISYQDTRKVEASYEPSQTTKTLIGYIVWRGYVQVILGHQSL
jgi:hypothetical protein